jgi:hypothetical protein
VLLAVPPYALHCLWRVLLLFRRLAAGDGLHVCVRAVLVTAARWTGGRFLWWA